MFTKIETSLVALTEVLPLELFVAVGSVVEEIVAPIPSPAIMVIAGSLAEAEGRGILGLIPLALAGAVGKTIGALVVYTIVDKSENFFTSRFGKFLNITPGEIERLGSKLGKGVHDYVLLTFLRALPVMPSVVISGGAGLLKISRTLFLVSTFFGTIIRDGFYLYAGYLGTEVLKKMVETTANLEAYVEVAIGVVILVFGFRYIRKKLRNRVNVA